MALLDNYSAFAGKHWETGTIHNFFAYRGFKAPHNGQVFSEPLLLGVSGGIVFGYFSFAYEGWDPILALLSRNTFDPFDRMLSRLGVMQNIKQTTNPDKAQMNLKNVLDEGSPAVVWVDLFNLAHTGKADSGGIPGMFPLLVYGWQDGHVFVADRAQQGFVIAEDEFLASWGRVKKYKYRMGTFEAPAAEKLQGAVSAGIWDTIKLFTEKPPKGGKNSFGFLAYQHWIKLLSRPKTRLSWEKEFPRGVKLFAGLKGGFTRTNTFGQAQGGADRRPYAAFLREAAVILDKPELEAAAELFLASADAWEELGRRLLPADVPLLAETRQLLEQKRDRFYTGGGGTGADITALNNRLSAIRAECESDFPMSHSEVEAQRASLVEQIQAIHDLEFKAICKLKASM